MRTETRTVHIGEWLGPVDWTFDFDSWGWDRGGSGNPTLIEPSKAALRDLERWIEDEKPCEVGEHQSWHRVIRVGMYDGWPFWRPVPSVLYATFLGSESTSWFGIGARILKEARDA